MLLCRPTRAPNEGMYGYLLRLAEANGLVGIAQLWPDRKPSIDALERRLGTQHWPQNRTMLDETLPQLTCRPGTRPIWNLRHSRYCPCCLSESPQWKWEWELTLFTSCPQHGVELVEECPGCSKKLNWGRQSLMTCDCGHSLTSVEPKASSQSERQLAEIFYAKLYRQKTNRKHLAELSLEQLHQVTFMLGAYAKNDGRKFSQKISNLHDITVVRPLMSAAANILTKWPIKFHALLASLRKAGEIDVQDQRLSKRFGFFYHYVYRNLKEPEFAFLLQAFEGYISRTWKGSLAERNSRLSPDMRRRHTWVPIIAMAKELKTTKRKLQVLIKEGRIESSVSKTPAGRSLTCVSRQQIAEMRMALDDVLDFQQTCQQLGLTKLRTTQLMQGKVIDSVFQPRRSGTARWGIPKEHVGAILSYGWNLPVVAKKDRSDLVSLAHALRSLLREKYLFPELVLDVLRQKISPLAVSGSTEGLPGWLFDRSTLLAWITEQREVSYPGYVSVPVAARKLGIRQQAMRHFVWDSNLSHKIHRDRYHMLILESALEEFANKFVFCHELQAQFNLIPAYFIPRLMDRGVIPVSGPKLDGGRIFLFSRQPNLFEAMNNILFNRKCACEDNADENEKSSVQILSKIAWRASMDNTMSAHYGDSLRNAHEYLDYQKLLVARAVLESVDVPTIRHKSISNLDRWNAQGTWCSAHDEWREIMTSGSDADVFAAMTGLDERANRLRQSPPYVGLIAQKVRKEIIQMVQLLRKDYSDFELPAPLRPEE